MKGSQPFRTPASAAVLRKVLRVQDVTGCKDTYYMHGLRGRFSAAGDLGPEYYKRQPWPKNFGIINLRSHEVSLSDTRGQTKGSQCLIIEFLLIRRLNIKVLSCFVIIVPVRTKIPSPLSSLSLFLYLENPCVLRNFDETE